MEGLHENELQLEINITKKSKKTIPVKIRLPIKDLKEKIDSHEEVIEIKGTVVGSRREKDELDRKAKEIEDRVTKRLEDSS
jgi:hypothetical protein